MAAVLIVAGLLAATGAAVVTDSGTVNVQVTDRTGAVVDATTAQGAFVSYFGDQNTTFGSAGTGTFNPFVRLQGSPTEQGYNTNGTTEFDTKTGTWTHAIKVSEIPQRPCPQVNPTLRCYELFVDINDNNSTPYISLNKVEVYYTSSATLTGYPFSGSATQVYAFNGNILIHDVNQGSGRGDLRYDIPINGANGVGLPTNCNYGNPLCNTYFVLYSQWGTTSQASPDGNGYSSDGGFEEWRVKVYPTPPDVQVVKTPDSEATAPGTVNAGSNAVFTITVTNNGPITATAVTLTDVLPAGSWTVGGANAAACAGTNPHAGGTTLTCNFGDVPFPGSRTITLTYPTVAADCSRSGTQTGDIDNTASISATNEDQTQLANDSDHGDVHVACAAIQILKRSTKGTHPLVKKAGAVFSITGPGNYSKSVTDNDANSGDQDSTTGRVCISGLAPGAYTVNETTPPSGYGGAGQTNVTANAVVGTDCATHRPAATDMAVFTNPPLSDIQVNFRDGGSTETSATITCNNTTGTTSTTPPSGWTTSKTVVGVKVNPAPLTITCTINIDP